MQQPTLSVFIPNYNNAPYISETLASILEQSLQPNEIIIVDDASTDNSIEIIEKFTENYPIIRLFRNQKNQGAILTCKRAIEITSGDYVFGIASDDKILPGLFEKSINLFKKYPQAGLCCSDLLTFDVQTGDTKEHRLYLSDHPRYFTPDEFLQIVLRRPINAMPIYDRTCIMRRSVAMETYGGFIPELCNYGSWFTHLVLGFRYGICYFPELSAVQRIEPVSYHKTQQKDLSGQLEVLTYMLELLETATYSDVKPYFQRTASLSNFPSHILHGVSRNPQYWSYISPRLLQHISSLDLLFDQSLEPLQRNGEIDCLRAILLFNFGRLTEAREIALSVLKYNPNHAKALAILTQLSSQTSLIANPANQQNANSQLSVDNHSSLDNQRQERLEIANKWINLQTEQLESAYLGEIGKKHQSLLNSEIKYEVLTPAENSFVNQLSGELAKGFYQEKAINYLLAAMLYRGADQLPLKYDRAPIPKWFANDYIKFMFASPNLFQEMGEVDNYYNYFQKWLSYVHSNIINNPDSVVWQGVASFFAKNSNFIPLYFTKTENLRDVYSKRADIIEFALKLSGNQLDYAFPNRPNNRNKIRLGILKEHFFPQTETFATIPVFKYLDRNQFEIFLYAINTNGHPLEQHCQSYADKLVKLSPDLNTQVQTIRADDLDILWIATNLTAVSKPSNLLALHRLARVQVTSINSPTTTGLRHIDYYIAGNLTADTETFQAQYQEKLVNIPGSGLCFEYPIPDPLPVVKPTRASWGANDSSVVFISGANFYKIIPEVRETWAKIIASVPNSVLVLYPFNPNWTNAYPAMPFINQMRAVFAKYGIDTNRVVFIKSLPSIADIKECLKIADVYLDSYPYSGATSLVDPLIVGLPSVVMEGNALRFRQASALLRSLSIPNLITNNEESYIKLAVSLGNNPQMRQHYRQQIQQKMQQNPPFLDSRSYSAQMGALFQDLFQKWQNNSQSSITNYPTVTTISQPQTNLTVNSQEFLNRVIGCVNLYYIDPTEQSIVTELRQLRKQFADFWVTVPSSQLESVYQGYLVKAYQALMGSEFRNESLTEAEETFRQQLSVEVAKGIEQSQAINYFLAVMPYYPTGKMRVQNARTRLPHWLIKDYEQFFEPVGV